MAAVNLLLRYGADVDVMSQVQQYPYLMFPYEYIDSIVSIVTLWKRQASFALPIIFRDRTN